MKKRQPLARSRRTRDAHATRARILTAAMIEFSNRGLADTRTEDIAARSNVNKRLIYYYFGSKEGLYLAALESTYAKLVELEAQIEVEHLDPVSAIAALINLKIDYYIANPHFISFVSIENLYKGKNLQKSKRLKEFKTPLTKVIGRILERGERMGVFRPGIDPLDLYVSICALCMVDFSNRYTLGTIFARDLTSSRNIQKRREVVVDLIVSYLRKGEDHGSAKFWRAENELQPSRLAREKMGDNDHGRATGT